MSEPPPTLPRVIAYWPYTTAYLCVAVTAILALLVWDAVAEGPPDIDIQRARCVPGLSMGVNA